MTIIEYARSCGYLKYWPYMSNKPNEEPDGNTLLYTSILFYIAHKRKELTSLEAMTFHAEIESCMPTPGLLNKGYGRRDHQAHDDYIGVALFSKYCLPMGINNPAVQMVSYGFRNGWVYNNTKDHRKSLDSDHSKFFGTVSHYKNCAGIPIGQWERLGW